MEHFDFNREYNEFVCSVWKKVRTYPKDWRQGQKVFNAVEALYGNVARQVQFGRKVDCFYDDNMIDPFLENSWDIIKNDLLSQK
jgi:hypothetical protein